MWKKCLWTWLSDCVLIMNHGISTTDQNSTLLNSRNLQRGRCTYIPTGIHTLVVHNLNHTLLGTGHDTCIGNHVALKLVSADKGQHSYDVSRDLPLALVSV
ncbi:hypothetical protein BDY19DRAFT_367460 [Irpex rosettiformis]|uniref:Uncharacterized protein n=1 Tax=Irpex rosettiformis TaxID=378272 RepID=A0ACB8TW91_9APHY|nr:hypothetical protein BDY19DRAFT_367460 [Irpex rosettiformis]